MDALIEFAMRCILAAEQYALEHPEDPTSADVLYDMHEFWRRVDPDA